MKPLPAPVLPVDSAPSDNFTPLAQMPRNTQQQPAGLSCEKQIALQKQRDLQAQAQQHGL